MRKEIINDNTNITSNSTQLKILKKNFPSCFDKNGAFIPHKMEEIVGNSGLELSKESYSLNWLGKSYARLLANENPLTFLKEDTEHNQKEENKNSENILIKGDNLEVLKHLKNAYTESIKMIYIDPPYNTGDDGFIYNDNRKFTTVQLAQLAGIEEDEAKRILDFTRSNANSHSAWLTFMYPRLYIARELLKDDGVIFISIDDNEASQLKLLCNEIFGEENFVGSIAWESKTKSQNTKTSFNKLQPKVEHILLYTKENMRRFNLIKVGEKKYPQEDAKGIYREYKLEVMDAGGIRGRETMIYPIKGILPSKNKQWKLGEDSINEYIEKDDLFIQDNAILLKIRPDDESQDISQPFWGLLQKDIGTAESAKKELSAILKNKNHGFETVKPIALIQRLIFHATDENDTILDFFAGSGTTAHTVMCSNKDNGNRKFITVQLPEKINPKNKTAYEYVKNKLNKEPNIFEITKARIVKGISQIKEEIEKDTTKNINDFDLGFKIYETTPIFDGYLDDIEDLTGQTVIFNGSILDDEQLGYLLTTWKVYDGNPLTSNLISIKFDTYAGYYGKDCLYFMDKGFTTKDLKSLIDKLDNDKDFQPSKLILFGYNFESKNQREIQEALANYKNKKSLDLDMIIRY